MGLYLLFLIYFLNLFALITCPYPENGNEVVPGSVLLPATRRGRFLASIIRRQAVDGTSIKFNKNADRINAEAKKKVDVLSDDLLPYIIAEQDRRIALYKRVMTAIQNGEKGVTIAEIRNKPPVIIRKGVMYRCPANRAPKEPDGSGILMCEDDIKPTQIIFDSCLSAEDKELFVADSKYFFCNRRRTETAEAPRDGSMMIGCAPLERTSFKYTVNKCAVEDTDDVMVQYRYYPDNTYKFVVELDSDHEVCDHWNPCQIGYLFSLPSLDQAVTVKELWRDYVENVGEDELVPPIPEDAIEEFVHYSATNYKATTRRLPIPEGYKFARLWAHRNVDNYGWSPQRNHFGLQVEIQADDKFVTISMQFPEVFSEYFYSSYYAVFTKTGKKSKSAKYLKLLPAMVFVSIQKMQFAAARKANVSSIPFKCYHCRLQGIIVRTVDGHVSNIEPSMYRIMEADNHQTIEMMIGYLQPEEYGDFFAIVQNSNGIEERIKVLEIQKIKIEATDESLNPGVRFEKIINFECANCELTDVVCNGDSAIVRGWVTIALNTIVFKIPKFDNSFACVLIGLFTKKKGSTISKKILTIENGGVDVTKQTLSTPETGQPFVTTIKYHCEECLVDAVTANGIPLMSEQGASRRSFSKGSNGFFFTKPGNIIINITSFISIFEGEYQAIFSKDSEGITKTILVIGDGDNKGTNPASDTTPDPEANSGGATTPAASPGETTAPAATDATTALPEGETTAAVEGQAAAAEGETAAPTEAAPAA